MSKMYMQSKIILVTMVTYAIEIYIMRAYAKWNPIGCYGYRLVRVSSLNTKSCGF